MVLYCNCTSLNSASFGKGSRTVPFILVITITKNFRYNASYNLLQHNINSYSFWSCTVGITQQTIDKLIEMQVTGRTFSPARYLSTTIDLTTHANIPVSRRPLADQVEAYDSRDPVGPQPDISNTVTKRDTQKHNRADNNWKQDL